MLSTEHKTGRAWRKPVAVGAALMATAALSVGFTMAASASGGGNTTDVTFVPLNPAFKLETNHAIAANGTLSAVVIGGSTKIPSNATTVQLSVTASGTAAGTLNVYPAGDVSGGSGQYLSWSAGGTDTQTIEENVGLSDELTFADVTAAVKLTATITGYSTQVTDGDVSGLDGNSGQVLTNNGSGGASWANPQGGSGAASTLSSAVTLTQFPNIETVQSLSVSAGTYFVSWNADVDNTGTSEEEVECGLFAPSGNSIQEEFLHLAAGANTMLALQGMDDTAGGKFTVGCEDQFATAKVGVNSNGQLDAIELSSATGSVTH